MPLPVPADVAAVAAVVADEPDTFEPKKIKKKRNRTPELRSGLSISLWRTKCLVKQSIYYFLNIAIYIVTLNIVSNGEKYALLFDLTV